MIMKKCTHPECSEKGPQPLSDFNKSVKHNDGLAYWCKKCNKNYCRSKYDSEYNSNIKLLSAYGITLEKKKSMFLGQHGKCAICLVVFSKLSSAHVDHDHKTGVVRGLLCGNCNNGLGRFKDSHEFLESASKYLKNSGLSS